MLKNTFAGTSPFNMILGVSLCTLGGAMLYMYFTDKDDTEDDKPVARKTTKKQQQKPRPPEPIKSLLVVTMDEVAMIMGRNGTNLASIEEKTHTKIRFRDKNDTHKYCDITGLPENVRAAKFLVVKEVERPPIVQEEMFLPQSVCGRIMGRCGEAMQLICRASRAKVSLDGGVGRQGSDQRRIVITGNRLQVNTAIKMLQEKIEQDEELQRSIDENEQRREPRRSPFSSMHSSQNSLNILTLPSNEKLVVNRNSEAGVEVYVSAIASPFKFWVQMIGEQSKKLDDLVAEMTSYYEVEENRENHRITKPYLGQIVTAAFKFDGKWYRAEIVGILPNQYNTEEVVLDLYFVDYGDSEYVAPHEVFELRTDFLTLRFQAVECFLSNVKPNNGENTWDAKAIEKFEELTQGEEELSLMVVIWS